MAAAAAAGAIAVAGCAGTSTDHAQPATPQVAGRSKVAAGSRQPEAQHQRDAHVNRHSERPSHHASQRTHRHHAARQHTTHPAHLPPAPPPGWDAAGIAKAAHQLVLADRPAQRPVTRELRFARDRATVPEA
jgi:hypothetical protein